MKKTVRFLTLMIAAVMLVSLCITPAAAFSYNVKYYRDVPKNAWYYNEVGSAISNCLMEGVGKDRFSPNGKVTREQFVTILMRLDGKIWQFDADAAPAVAFTDVKAGAWYAAGVKWAEQLNVTEGVSEKKFGVGNAITREEMATIIARYVKNRGITLPSAKSPVKAFADAKSISSWAVDAADLMRRSGIINGKDGSIFDPKAVATRAEVAALAVRLYTNMYVDFNVLTDPDAAAHITFTDYELVQGSGYIKRTYKVTAPAEIKAICKYLNDGKAATAIFPEAATGPAVDSMSVRFKDGSGIDFIMSKSSLGINGYKRYTFNDGYLQRYYDLMTVQK